MIRRSSIITSVSMMNFSRVLSAVVLAVLSLTTFVGCTTTADYTLGTEFVPSNQNLELRRRVYRAGVMSEGDRQEQCQLSTTRLYLTDSIRSSKMEYAYLGYERSDTFGVRRAGFMTQMVFGLSLDEERGWGYRPIFDSMTLSLFVNDYHGDTTYKQRFEVYEITSNDYFNLPEGRDTLFCINFDPKPYISQEPIFTFTYPDQERGVYVGDMESPGTCTITLQETSATDDYVKRLMFMTDEAMAENGDYALDKDGIYEVGNEKEFVEQVRGVYIVPAEEQSAERGAMFSTKLSGSYLYLYARSRYEEDPTIIRDTTEMSYNFYIDPKYDIEAGNVSFTTVDHDFSDVTLYNPSLIEASLPTLEREEVAVGFVDGMGGVVTEVMFSDEFIQSLADVALSRPDAVVSVNKAALSVYLDGSDYDYMVIDPMLMTPIMEAAMGRLGLYTDYDNQIAITDYLYTQESSSVQLAYDGYLNRSLACYTMDMSTCVQSLMLAAADNLLEDGVSVDLEKFSPDNTSDESLVDLRRFYIGPAADAMFGFNREAVYGGDNGIGTNPAPITLDITYTIVY